MKLKLNWFSPLPPLRTDIGHYTARILEALAARAEVTLWTTQDKWDRSLERLAPVKRWKLGAMPWPDLHGGDLNIYNIGNNPDFHGEIMELARIAPGLVVLHDTRLLQLLRYFLPMEAYRAAMAGLYGAEGLEAADGIEAGAVPIEAVAERFPMTAYVTANALGVLLHNRLESDALAAWSDVPVFDMPLPYDAGPAPIQAEAESIRSGPVRLIQFGYLGQNRQIDKIFEALAGLPDKGDFRLDVYGYIWDRPLLEKWIRQQDLDGVVHLHGFVEEAELDRAIQAAELVFNLRWPTMGEASGSLLRAWSAMRPCLVTNVGWYRHLPADAAFFVEPGREIDDIRRHLRALKGDPTPFRRSGVRGREILVTRHDPGGYADQLVAHAESLLAGDAGVSRSVGRRLGRCLGQWPAERVAALDLAGLAGRLGPAP